MPGPSVFRLFTVHVSSIVLDFDADLYKNNGLRPSNWTVDEYVTDWENIAGAVVQAAGINGRDGPVSVQGAEFANQGFTPRQIFDRGILSSAPGKAISV